MADSLGDRMKEYESCNKILLTKNQDYIIRLDGRHFHSLTKGFDKPFDYKFIDIMREVAKALLKEVQGAKLAYVQSDEISIYLTDKTSINSMPYFNNNLQKIVSITASFATMKFNELLRESHGKQGMFDSRIFQIPNNEIPNYFIWRQRDWNRNSVSMLARSLYSSKELHKKNQSDMHQMIFEKGKNWNNLEPHIKNGTFFKLDGREIIEFNDKYVYEDF